MGDRYVFNRNLFWEDKWFSAKFELPHGRRSIHSAKFEQKIDDWMYNNGKGDWCSDTDLSHIVYVTNNEDDALYLKLLGAEIGVMKNRSYMTRDMSFVPTLRHKDLFRCGICYRKTIYKIENICLNCNAIYG